MTTPQVLMTKARIASFLAKLKASKSASVIRRSRPYPGMASMKGNHGETHVNIGA